MNELNTMQAVLAKLQIVAVVLTILAVVGPIAMFALFWHLSKTFVTKSEFNGQGSRVTALESMSIMNKDRADQAHERIDKMESALTVELRYMRRDLDRLIGLEPDGSD